LGQRGRIGTGIAATIAILLLTVSAAARPSADPPTAYNSPPAEPKPCLGPIAGVVAISKTEEAWPRPLCGTRGNDQLKALRASGPGEVFGYQGDDVLDARNGKPDEVYGGPGRDSGRFDACDKVRDMEAVTGQAPTCPGVTKRTMAKTGLDYPSFRAKMECSLESDGVRRVRFIRYPSVRAADATPQVDFQTVAWYGYLYKLGPDGAWRVARRSSGWLWDRTYDLQVTNAPANVWRSFVTNDPTGLVFHPQEPGTYRAAVKYHWYATADAPAYDRYIWVRDHYGPYEDPTRTMCVFPN
jgi:hypothetical protein